MNRRPLMKFPGWLLVAANAIMAIFNGYAAHDDYVRGYNRLIFLPCIGVAVSTFAIVMVVWSSYRLRASQERLDFWKEKQREMRNLWGGDREL